MKLKELTLENIGQFSNLVVPFAPTREHKFNNTIIIGNNGAGKSTILESIALSLSWFVGRLKFEKGGGTTIQEIKIKNSLPWGAISVTISDQNDDFLFSLAKARKGKKSEKVTRLEDLNKLVNRYKEKFDNDSCCSFPILTYYDANRGVLDIPLKIRGKHTFEQLDGYDNSLRGIVDYRRFFEWFREREDIENESKVRFFNTISEHGLEDINEKIKQLSDPQLNAVRKALNIFLPEFRNMRVARKPRLHMAVDKNGEQLNVEQLSQGEKLVMALVGDIARRLAIMNPEKNDVLGGEGIVLIDEAELHLHPKWQRLLVERLSITFPNCQFIYTTHSPLLISDYKEVLCFSLDNGELTPVDELYGLDVNQVLLDAMDTDIRNIHVQETIDELRARIQERKVDEAEKLYDKLLIDLPENHIEVIKSRLLIRKLRLNETNS